MGKTKNATKRATPLVTHREFKLLIVPEAFPNRRAVVEFNERLAQIAKKLGVAYEPAESVDSQLRIVQFYDTKAEDLRKNKLIFRIRQIREGGWPGESWELTFKCRADDYETAAQFDTDTTMANLQKKKFKEELVRGDAAGSMRSIFSNNVIVEYPEVSAEVPLGRLADALPFLKTLGLDEEETMAVVSGAKVFEIQSTLGTVALGHGVSASVTLAVWARPIPDAFEPLVAELGFSTRVDGTEKNAKGQRDADEFFKAVQVALGDVLASGTTKTALIYGDDAS